MEVEKCDAHDLVAMVAPFGVLVVQIWLLPTGCFHIVLFYLKMIQRMIALLRLDLIPVYHQY
jgi:hypothetical protein